MRNINALRNNRRQDERNSSPDGPTADIILKAGVWGLAFEVLDCAEDMDVTTFPLPGSGKMWLASFDAEDEKPSAQRAPRKTSTGEPLCLSALSDGDPRRDPQSMPAQGFLSSRATTGPPSLVSPADPTASIVGGAS